MLDLDRHYKWRRWYTAEEDLNSPFYKRVYSEFESTNAIYDTPIHPQWDEFGSLTLYAKVLFVNYDLGFAIIEFIGEWNDLIYNDIMYLYRNMVEVLLESGINKYILIGENVHAFHADDDSYYEEWTDQMDNGWIVGLGFLEHNMDEMMNAQIDRYVNFDYNNDFFDWRTIQPDELFQEIDVLIIQKIKQLY